MTDSNDKDEEEDDNNDEYMLEGGDGATVFGKRVRAHNSQIDRTTVTSRTMTRSEFGNRALWDDLT